MNLSGKPLTKITGYCHICLCPQYGFTAYHDDDCRLNPNNIPSTHGTCETCNIELNDCNWAYWVKDKKLCREHSSV